MTCSTGLPFNANLVSAVNWILWINLGNVMCVGCSWYRLPILGWCTLFDNFSLVTQMEPRKCKLVDWSGWTVAFMLHVTIWFSHPRFVALNDRLCIIIFSSNLKCLIVMCYFLSNELHYYLQCCCFVVCCLTKLKTDCWIC